MALDPWARPAAAPALAGGAVHVWRVDLAVPADALLPVLAADERVRAAAFVFPADGARYAVAHAALRAILAGYLGADPSRVAFTRDDGGKPRLAGGGPHFNLAHSADVALVAVADREIGVDVERVRPDLDDEALAARFFSPSESAALRALPRVARAGAFFRLWTLKEAYVKGRGDGLARALDSFSVTLSAAEPALDGPDGAPTPDAFWLHELPLAPGYVAAIAAAPPRTTIRYWRWHPPDPAYADADRAAAVPPTTAARS